PKHYILKDAIHELFNNMEMDRSYIRTQCYINGRNKPSAYVYHTAMQDPDTYDPAALGAVSTDATPVASVVTTPAVAV
ncbi:hypothetical protein ACKI16_48280, partial [Streptomyces scabiei]|uniref:hypothetical protein n=1 Tax=Streptomyces scabiei TaxID=1930 RepID=UPI0038F738FE